MKKNIGKKIRGEIAAIQKPSLKEQFTGTFSTIIISMIAALSISAVDSVFTALLGLLL